MDHPTDWGQALLTYKNKLFGCDSVRTIERLAIENQGISEFELMARAGLAAFECMRKNFPQAKTISIYCGAGNNGGDAYVLARHAQEAGMAVRVIALKSQSELPQAAARAAAMAQDAGIDIRIDKISDHSDADLIIDAILGIGLQGEVRGKAAEYIQNINDSQKPVLSLDLPSGLNADTGHAYDYCVQATHTITFIAAKAGLYTLDGPDVSGVISCADLGLSEIIKSLDADAVLLNANNLPFPLPARKKNVHKGDFGRVLVIGGGPGMPGAAVLAAKAALRTGAGSVSIASRPEHVAAMLPVCPEAMIHAPENKEALDALIEKSSVLILGPGLGESAWALTCFKQALDSGLPAVVDASALTLLAKHKKKAANWILTPHPGEAASLLGCSVKEIQADRFSAVKEIANTYGGVAVLKGVGSLIYGLDQTVYLSTSGNPGMATAGMGDVLSGIIAGFIAQSYALDEAATMAVYLHGDRADRIAEQQAQRGMLASDLLTVPIG